MNETNLAKVNRIEDRIDKVEAGAVPVSSGLGGLQFSAMSQVMEFAKLMAVSDIAVPKHLRANPGACMAVCIQAVEWRMSPYAVANKSYVVNDRISYESQLIHAVIEQRAPLVGRLRCRYTGEGDGRRCIVWARVRGEEEPFEYQSAPFGQIQPKNSPLWKTKPDLQLFYNASRDWARMYFPDVILGVYAEDEIEGPAEPTLNPMAKKLAERRAAITAKPSDDSPDNPLAPDDPTADPAPVAEPAQDTAPAADPPPGEPTAAPALMSWDDAAKAATAKRPEGMTSESALFRFGQWVQKAYGNGQRKATGEIWAGLSVETQVGVLDLVSGGSFPWK